MRAFLSDEAYGSFVKPDPNTGEQVLCVRAEKEPPDVGVEIGECLFNLRSALDHLAYSLWVAHSGAPSERERLAIAFPICRSPEAFRGSAPQAIGKIAPQAQGLIEAMQPYSGGGEYRRHWLFALNTLCNIDKHRHLHTVFAVVRHSQLTLTAPPGMRLAVVPTRDLGRRAEHGAELLRFRVVSGEPNSLVRLKGRLEFELAFDEESSEYNVPVLSTLNGFRDSIIEHILPALEPFLIAGR